MVCAIKMVSRLNAMVFILVNLVQWLGQRLSVINATYGITGDNFVIVEHCQNIEDLRELGLEWIHSLQNDKFGLCVDIETIKADLANWANGEGAILIAKDQDTNHILGMFALFAVPSYLGEQKLALEKYWYTREGSHFAGPKLYIEALNWARKHDCSHIITSGSKMISDRHDSICRFLEKTGAQHFETSYIYEL